MSAVYGLVLCAVAFLVDIFGLTVPYWYTTCFANETLHFSLWDDCDTGLANETFHLSVLDGCKTDLGILKDDWQRKFQASRGLEVLGTIAIFTALVLAVFNIYGKKNNMTVYKAAGVFAFLAAIFMIVGDTVFVFAFSYIPDVCGKENDDFGVGLTLNILASGFIVFSGVLFLHSNEQGNQVGLH